MLGDAPMEAGARKVLSSLFSVGEERARRLLGGFANALLDTSVPSVNAFLRGRLGPGASVERVTMEGPSLVLHDAVLPLSAGAELRVARASFDLTPGAVPPVRLATLAGALEVNGGAFRAPITFERSSAAPPGAWAHGDVKIHGATWTDSGTAARPHVPLAGRARITVAEREWALESGELEAGDARVQISARGSLEPGESGLGEARVALERGRTGHFLDAIGALVGRELARELPLFCDFSLDGEVAYHGRGDDPGVKASLALTTAASKLSLEAKVRETGEIDAATLRGPLSLADLELHPAAASRIVLDEEARLDLDVQVTGTATEPRAWGTAVARALTVRARGDKRFVPAPRLLDVTLSADATRDGFMARLECGLDGGGHIEAEVRGKRGEEVSGTGRVEGARAAILAHAIRLGAGRTILGVGDGPGLRIPEDAVASGTLELRGERITGKVHASTPRSSLDVTDVSVDDARASATVRGTLALHDATRTGAIPRQALELEAGGPLELEGVELSTDYASVVARGRVRAAALTVLCAGGVRIPVEGVELVGQAHVREGGALRAELGVTTGAGTKVIADVAADAEASLEGTRVKGKVAWRDALAAGLFATPLRPLAEEVVEIDGRISGPAAEPVLTARFSTPRVRVGLPESPKAAVYELTEASALLRLDVHRVLWHAAHAELYGGRVTSSGVVTHDGALRAVVVTSDVDVARVPADERRRALGEHVGGRLSGAVRFDRPAGSASASGRGEMVLDGGDYRALARAEKALATFGLPPLSTASAEPLVVEVFLDDRGWTLERVALVTEDGALRGAVRVGLDARVSGDLEIELRQAYLAKSRLLYLPATLTGGLRVKARLDGPIDRVRVETRLREVLASLAIDNRIARAVRGTVDEIRGALGGGDESAAPSPPVAPDRKARAHDVFDRLLEGDPTATTGLEALARSAEPAARVDEQLAALDAPPLRVRIA